MHEHWSHPITALKRTTAAHSVNGRTSNHGRRVRSICTQRSSSMHILVFIEATLCLPIRETATIEGQKGVANQAIAQNYCVVFVWTQRVHARSTLGQTPEPTHQDQQLEHQEPKWSHMACYLRACSADHSREYLVGWIRIVGWLRTSWLCPQLFLFCSKRSLGPRQRCAIYVMRKGRTVHALYIDTTKRALLLRSNIAQYHQHV